MNGVDSVKQAVQYFRDNGDMEVVNGYYGILLEIIDVDPVYYQVLLFT